MEQVKLLSMTVGLTVLIWVTADNLVNETVNVPVTFDVAATGPDMLVSSANQAVSYQVQVVGPRRTIAQVQAASPLSIRLRVPEHAVGILAIPLKESLKEQWREFHKVAVVSVSPPTLDVTVDRLKSYDLSVVITQPTLTYDVRPQHQPTSTRISMRESRYNELAPSGDLPPVDITSEVDRLLRQQVAGQSVTIPVSLDIRHFGPDAKVSPNHVDVTATVAAQRRTEEIPTVPILIAVSFANLDKPYRAVTRDGSEVVTQTIRVSGSTEDVARLVRGETRAYGLIHLKEEQFEQRGVFVPMTPEFHLPPGLDLAEKTKPIEIKLVETIDEEKR